MTGDPLDRSFSHGDDIVPSSGFAAGVMEAVRQDAATPPPIPFPWKRALPGLAAWALALAAFVAAALLPLGWRNAEQAIPAMDMLRHYLDAANALGAGWLAMVLVVSFVSFRLAMRLAGGRV